MLPGEALASSNSTAASRSAVPVAWVADVGDKPLSIVQQHVAESFCWKGPWDRSFPRPWRSLTSGTHRGKPLVSVRNLEKLDEPTAKDLAHRARGVFNDFMTSPWY